MQHCATAVPDIALVQCSDGNINPLAAIQHATMYQQNLCRLMELVLAPMLRSMQTCISQQQLQKQFGHRDNSVYRLQLPSQGSAAQSVAQPMAQPVAQPMAQLSTSMAQLLDVSGGNVGGLTPQVSGVSSVGSQSWDPSASLHLHQSLLQQQLPLQSQAQQPPSQAQPQAQSQTQPSYQMQQQPQEQSVAQQQMPQSLSHSSFSLPFQSQLQHPPAQLISDQQRLTNGPSGYQSEQPQVSTAQNVNVSIISPAIWTPADRPSPQLGTSASFGAPTETAQMANASAPAALHDDLAAAYGSSSFNSSFHPPSQQQQLQQQLPQQLSEKPLELRPRPPLGGNDSRRSIATNTQLTMHRGDSDAQSSGAARAPTGTSPAGLSPSADSGWGQVQAQGSGLYQAAQGSAGLSVSGQAFLHSQLVLRSSDSTGSLAMPVEGLEGRSSGQMPMRAGSPALGGRASPKPPSWSSHMHDPFGELVTQDLKRIGGSSSSIT